MIAVGVIDVGSPAAGNIGWAIIRPGGSEDTGGDLDSFIAAMIETAARYPVAIGFEAPLYVPFRSTAMAVLKARPGEKSRAWSAGAGAAVTTAGLGVVPYTLAGLRAGLPKASGQTQYGSLPTGPGEALFFEAFVSGADKDVDHRRDALRAVRAMIDLIKTGPPFVSALGDEPTFSLIGAAMLRTGWTTDLDVLSQPCLVVRPAPGQT